jgi:hypothetical protein
MSTLTTSVEKRDAWDPTKELSKEALSVYKVIRDYSYLMTDGTWELSEIQPLCEPHLFMYEVSRGFWELHSMGLLNAPAGRIHVPEDKKHYFANPKPAQIKWQSIPNGTKLLVKEKLQLIIEDINILASKVEILITMHSKVNCMTGSDFNNLVDQITALFPDNDASNSSN